MIKVFAFQYVPPFAQGLVRDLRVRWALEEAGIAYDAALLQAGDQATPAYRARQPFGQVPAYEEGPLSMFESGAIVLHIGERSEALLPKDEIGRARAITWVFAALNSIEVVVAQLGELFFHQGEAWVEQRQPQLEAQVKKRLGELATALGDRPYLEERFSAGDLMMTTVLRNLRDTDILDGFPTLKAYQARCEARPAFQRALDAQMAAFSAAA